MTAGDRVRYTIDGRTGVADEFLPDGDCFVTWDDGSFGCVKWNHLEKVGEMNSESAEQFKVGDVVKLKSGGPEMTIASIVDRATGKCCYCSWFRRDEALGYDSFDAAMLARVDPDRPPITFIG